jgi:predicted secreted protein
MTTVFDDEEEQAARALIAEYREIWPGSQPAMPEAKRLARAVLTNADASAVIVRLEYALTQIAGKNNLEGVAPEDCPSHAYGLLHECELIARYALEEDAHLIAIFQ